MNGFKTITGWHMLANMLVDVWIAFFGFPLIWCKKPPKNPWRQWKQSNQGEKTTTQSKHNCYILILSQQIDQFFGTLP